MPQQPKLPCITECASTICWYETWDFAQDRATDHAE
jgi:hypothetical protein